MTRFHLLRPLAVALPCIVVLAACGSESTSSQEGVAPGVDAGPDAQPDSIPPEEAGVDAADEPQPDVTPDVVLDTAQDQALDAIPDQTGDVADPWPTCDTQPTGVPTKTIAEIWQDNPTAATDVWTPGVIVTGVSKGGCAAGSACQIFLQTDETYADLAAGAHKAIKLFVSGNTSVHFTSVKVGDRVDVYAHAWRYGGDPTDDELLLQVNLQLRGCAKVVGTASPTPIPNVQLTDLTVDAYQNTLGPLLVQVQGVTGKPGSPTETFALWKTGGPFVDAGPETIVSASPYFLSGGAFSGLPTDGQTAVNFTSIAGVFGLFVPSADGGTATKYLEIYPRDMLEMPHP